MTDRPATSDWVDDIPWPTEEMGTANGSTQIGRENITGSITPQASASNEEPKPEPPTADGDQFPRTDYGNAERLVHHHGQDLLYCHPWVSWHAWDSRRWRKDDTAEVERRAKHTVRGMFQQALKLDGDERKALLSWAFKSEARARIDAMIAMARSEKGVPVLPDDLDADPWLLNARNGTLNLQTGQLEPHDRNHRLTKLAPATYDPDASCPTWLAFLDRAMNNDHAMVEFLQRAVGYSLTGQVGEECLFLPYGTGRNGKSKFLEGLRLILGDYAQQAPSDLLMAQRNEGIPNDIARLKGARLVTSVETKEGRRLDDALVKQLTGGDRITARFLRAEFFEFDPTHKLWLATNHKPVIFGTDEGIWSRIRLIPFTVFIPPEDRDPNLLDKFRLELPGILAWAVQGCLQWQRRGLDAPLAVQAATAEYRDEQDDLGSWIRERCQVGTQHSVRFADLYSDYTQWCERGQVRSLSAKAFGTSLTERGFDKAERHARTAYRLGIGLLHDSPLTHQG